MNRTRDELAARATAIVRGTQNPSSGDDLESAIRDALHWAYWHGVVPVRDALAPFALRAAEQAAGASYRALPDRVLDEDAHRRIERIQASKPEPSFCDWEDRSDGA